MCTIYENTNRIINKQTIKYIFLLCIRKQHQITQNSALRKNLFEYPKFYEICSIENHDRNYNGQIYKFPLEISLQEIFLFLKIL